MSMSTEVVTGVNLLKSGTDPPLLPDDQYPEWLWKLAEPEATLSELQRKPEDDLSLEEVSNGASPLLSYVCSKPFSYINHSLF
jgi:Mitochondrial ribosomal protein L37